MGFLVGAIGIVVVFGVVIFVHELGHFLAAKAVGVYAPRFSIGFGPALWRMRRGETEYVLAALPLGGYVRMASRHDEATAWIEGGSENAPPTVGGDGAAKIAQEDYPEGWDPEAMIPFGPKPIPEHRWFESKPLWARLVILVAGVTMNILLALLVSIVLLAVVGRPVIATRVVGGVADTTSAGRVIASAVSPGDTLRRIDGRTITRWDDVETALASARDTVRIETNRGSAVLALGDSVEGSVLASAVVPEGETILDAPIRGSAAARAGLRGGDRVRAIDGERIRTAGQLIRRVQSSPGRRLELSIVRGDDELVVPVVPDSQPAAGDRAGGPAVVGRIGVALASDYETAFAPISFGAAVDAGWDRTWQMGGFIFTALRRLGTGQTPLRELGGPVAIAVASARAAQSGLAELLNLIAFLSINVAIINLLPIPILDGGQILLNVAESAKGSEFSPRTRENILRFGLAAILVLFAIVLFNDTSLVVGLVRGIWN